MDEDKFRDIHISEDQWSEIEMVQAVFKTDAAKKLLEYWEHRYLYSPLLPAVDKAKSFPEWYPFMREGENRFLRKILSNINLYKIKHKQRNRNERRIDANG